VTNVPLRKCIARFIGDKETSFSQRNIFAMCIIGIIVINWLANYLLVNDFGLYIDDYGKISRVMLAMREGNQAIISTIFSSPLNVRFLHGDLIYAFSYIGLKLGGVRGIYLIGFFILSINSILTYKLLMRTTGNTVCSFMGAAAMVLYPVATVKVWLTAALGIQPALTLLLLSFIFYLKEKRFLPYLLATTSLFCYETFFWVFISAPLLVKRRSHQLIFQMAWHVAILSSIFTAYFFFKSFVSDPRLEEYGIADLFYTSLKHLIQGPYTNLVGNITILVKTLVSLNLLNLCLGLICAAGLFLLLNRLESFDKAKLNFRDRCNDNGASGYTQTSPTISDCWRILLVGLVMLVSSYPLSFLGGVTSIYGLGTRLHLAGTIGVSFIYAGVAGLVVFLFDKNKRKVGIALLSVWLSLLILYNFKIQQDYRYTTDVQRKFWAELIRLCPDLTDGTLIFFYPNNLRRTGSIPIFDWSTSYVLEKLYDFPSNWSNPPRVYVIKKPDWQDILFSDDSLTLSRLDEKGIVNVVNESDLERKIDTSKSIFLVYENGSLLRLSGRGKSIRESGKKNIFGRLQKGVLYNTLIGSTLDSDAR
jgi:hypothetical protein